jgi:hypothetical protein
MAEQYYLRHRGRVSGPFPEEKLKALAQKGQLTRMHELSSDGTTWFPARELPSIFPPKKASLQEPILEPDDSAAIAAQGSVGADRSQWYYSLGGQRIGPVSWSELSSLSNVGEIKDSTLVWREGMSDWRPASQMLSAGNAKPHKSGARKTLAILAASLLLVSGIGYAAWRYSPKPYITGPDDPRLEDAVYVVMQGYEVDSNGKPLFIPNRGTGTAFAVSPEGLLFTNRHVVDFSDDDPVRADLTKYNVANTQAFRVLVKGQFIKASVEYKSRNEQYDFACLKLEGQHNLPYFRLTRSSTPNKRDQVVALGFPGIQQRDHNPASLEELLTQTLEANYDYYNGALNQTTGTVSNIRDTSGVKWIVHGAVISPGNSGGPLIDMSGRVIGINTQGVPVIVVSAKGEIDRLMTPGEYEALSVSEIADMCEKRFPGKASWR